MAAAQEKTDDRLGLPGAYVQAAATGFYHTSSPCPMSPPHIASCSPLTAKPTVSLCTSDADNRTAQGCDSQHALGVHSVILWSCFLEVLNFLSLIFFFFFYTLPTGEQLLCRAVNFATSCSPQGFAGTWRRGQHTLWSAHQQAPLLAPLPLLAPGQKTAVSQ